MVKQRGMSIEALYKECEKQIKQGNGKKRVMISNDDEGNGYHELFYSFTTPIQYGNMDESLLPYGVTKEEFDYGYIILG